MYIFRVFAYRSEPLKSIQNAGNAITGVYNYGNVSATHSNGSKTAKTHDR